ICYAVDQNEAAQLAALSVFLEDQGLIELQLDHADIVELEAFGGKMLQRIDVDFVFERVDGRGDHLGGELHEVRATRENRGIAEPDERRFELVGRLCRRLCVDEDVTATYVNLVCQRDGYTLPRHGVRQIAISGHDTGNPTFASRG